MRSLISNNKQSKTGTDTPEKSNSAPATSASKPSPKEHKQQPTPAATTADSELDQQSTATIGPKIRINGELVGDENIVIHGKVTGTIHVNNHTVSVGKQGLVSANIVAKTIEVEGTVDGDLFGEQRIIVRSSSQLKGNLLANRVSLEDGAKFKGSVDMDIDSRKHVFNASRETAAKGEKNKLTEKAAPQA